MMNKKYRIILLVSILIMGGFFLFFLKIRDLDSLTHFQTESFMRNLTWQMGFQKNVPYKKGDTVEFSSVFSSDTSRYLSLDISSVKKFLDIESIELDGQIIGEDALLNLHLWDSSLLKLTGKAKNNSNNEDGIPPQITVKTIRTEKAQDEKKAPVIEKAPKSETQNLAIKQTHYNSNTNNLLQITGSGLTGVDFVNIGGVGFKPVFGNGTLYVKINRDTFATGEYFLFFQLSNGKIITPSEKISFQHSTSRINIANITPDIIKNDEDRFIVIQGNGFDKIISIQLSNNLILKNAELHLINNQVAGVKIPKGLPDGEYYFNIMDTNSIYELRDMKFTITH